MAKANRIYNVCEVFVLRTGPALRNQYAAPVWESVKYSAEVACEQAAWHQTRDNYYVPTLALYVTNKHGVRKCKGGFFGN